MSGEMLFLVCISSGLISPLSHPVCVIINIAAEQRRLILSILLSVFFWWGGKDCKMMVGIVIFCYLLAGLSMPFAKSSHWEKPVARMKVFL